jgi:hypothetical protein
MTTVTANGNTYTDDGSGAKDMRNGGHRTHLLPMLTDVMVEVGNAETYADDAAASAAAAAGYVAALTATSATSTAVGSGSKTFITQSGKQFAAGGKVIVARTSAPTTTWMYGEVTSYSSTTLVVNVTDTLGSGTYTDWTISVAGIKGATGATGGTEARLAITGATTLGASDGTKNVCVTSGTFTLGFVACATLGSGWFCTVYNLGSGEVTLDPNSTEQIDGLTTYKMYPGEARKIFCDGAALYSIVLKPFYTAFTANGTFTKPPGYQVFGGLAWGGGGGGGKYTSGAGGGGGGACVPFHLLASAVGTTETITIGSGGAGATVDAAGGSDGGNTTVGSLVTAYGGGGAPASSQYGGGGGSATAAGSGASGSMGASTINMDGVGGAYGSNANAYTSGWGGGGASGGASIAYAGGESVYGGGGGAGVTSAGATSAGGASKFGGAGGGSADASSGTAGTAPAGGGGATKTGSAAGAGARGEVRIWGVA